MSSSEFKPPDRRKFLQYLAGSPLLAAGGLEAFAANGRSRYPSFPTR